GCVLAWVQWKCRVTPEGSVPSLSPRHSCGSRRDPTRLCGETPSVGAKAPTALPDARGLPGLAFAARSASVTRTDEAPLCGGRPRLLPSHCGGPALGRLSL